AYLVAPAATSAGSQGRALLLVPLLVVALALAPPTAVAADCREAAHCLANSVRGSYTALAAVALLIGLFAAPEVFVPPPAPRAATRPVTARDRLTAEHADRVQRSLGVLPLLAEPQPELARDPRPVHDAAATGGGT